MERLGRWFLAGYIALGIFSSLSMVGCRAEDSPGRGTPAPKASGSPAAAQPQSMPTGADDGQWLMAAKDYANTRYSALNQINTGNVQNLKVAWTFSTGVTRGHEGAPLVVGDTMYLVTPFPNILYAFDLTQPGAPTKWSYKPEPSAAAQGVACCDVVNRGAAYADGRIFYNTLDNRTIAVDAASGQPRW